MVFHLVIFPFNSHKSHPFFAWQFHLQASPNLRKNPFFRHIPDINKIYIIQILIRQIKISNCSTLSFSILQKHIIACTIVIQNLFTISNGDIFPHSYCHYGISSSVRLLPPGKLCYYSPLAESGVFSTEENFLLASHKV